VASSPGPALDTLATGPGVMRHAVPIRRQPDPARDCLSLARLYRLMRRIRPHAVHAHTPKAGLLGMAAARLARVPVRLYTVHGLPLETRTGTLRRILEAAERASAALSTQTYTISESVRDLMIRLELCPAAKLRVLGHGSCAGVDVERFRPATPEMRESARRRFGIPVNAVLVTFVGRLARDKGIGTLAEAWPEASRSAPNLHLLLAGEPDASDPVPEAALRTLRQHPAVHFAGSVPHEEVPAVYAATDVAVLPTFREGLSQFALEAGAAGVPIVSTRVSGVVNSVLDGVTGLLVEPAQPVPLRDALLHLAADPDLRARLGAAAREHIESCYSEERVNSLWMAEYLRLVEMAWPERVVLPAAIESR